jgi:anti-anti-sigma factor
MPDPVIVSTPGITLSISTWPDTVVAHCRGSFTFETCAFVKTQLKDRLPEKGRMVLDLSEVTRMDSSGLGTIVGLYLSAKRRNCELDLINLNKQIRDLLAISNLLSIFETVGRHGMRMP